MAVPAPNRNNWKVTLLWNAPSPTSWAVKVQTLPRGARSGAAALPWHRCLAAFSSLALSFSNEYSRTSGELECSVRARTRVMGGPSGAKPQFSCTFSLAQARRRRVIWRG